MSYIQGDRIEIQKRTDAPSGKAPMLLAQLKKHRLILATMIMTPIALIMDSPTGDSLLVHGQATTNFLMFLYFLFLAYRKASPRVRQMMLIGMFVGFGMETLYSLVLGWYHYRLGNVPIWVAFAHGILFWLVSRLSRITWMRSVQFQYILLAFVVLYSTSWLYVARDWFGFLCTIGFLVVLLTAKKFRPFLLIIFTLVIFIEQTGPAVGCWHWSEMVMGIPSGNPPSGIAVFYLTFEIGVLWIYLNLLHPKTKKRYLSSPFRGRAGK